MQMQNQVAFNMNDDSIDRKRSVAHGECIQLIFKDKNTICSCTDLVSIDVQSMKKLQETDVPLSIIE